MRTIYKYPLTIPHLDVALTDPRPLHVGLDPHGTPCVWIEHDIDRDPTRRLRFYIVGTGHPLIDDTEYFGTFRDGSFIWHVYQGEATL